MYKEMSNSMFFSLHDKCNDKIGIASINIKNTHSAYVFVSIFFVEYKNMDSTILHFYRKKWLFKYCQTTLKLYPCLCKTHTCGVPAYNKYDQPSVNVTL